MIHHAGVEIRPEDADAEVAFWALLGFAEVEPPAALRERARWVERDGAQVHLLYADEPFVPGLAHVAVVAPDLGEVVARLRAAGHEAAPRAEHWGAARTQVRSPAGHLVEVMAAAPGPLSPG